MLKLTFSPAEARVLARERFHHPHPHVRRKMEALWLKSQGLAHQEIARLAGVSGKTLRSYLQEYVEGGVTRLKELRFRQPQSELVAHQEAIVTYFQAHPPASINTKLENLGSDLVLAQWRVPDFLNCLDVSPGVLTIWLGSALALTSFPPTAVRQFLDSLEMALSRWRIPGRSFPRPVPVM
jgi:transposase